MLDNSFVRETFDAIATNGFIGDPNGEIAYSYIRVSSVHQAEDGRSGLPRQIQHCHEVSREKHLRIPWEMVFADDGYSGFDFDTRPALSRLREEFKTKPRSCYVVMEHLDRLSRNARWHQGFLLDEMNKYHITPVFWKAFGSEIERAVLGTIAEEGMRSEISRMMDGQILKAKSGRVTAKRPRFGYKFVDSNGQASEKARQDTHYAIELETSKIVRWIYASVLRQHKSLRMIAFEMNQKKIPTQLRGKIWCGGTIWRIISDPIYKGEFYARRYYVERTGKLDERGRPRGVTRERPPEEWIKIEVPAIVTPEEWQRTQEILAANRTRSTRNMKKREWLLSTFLKCDICGYALNSARGGSKKQGFPLRYYICNSRNTDRALIAKVACYSPGVRADKLEAFIWSKVEDVLTNPELVVQLLEEADHEGKAFEEEEHLRYIESQLAEATKSYARWEKAYGAGVIPIEELDGHRQEFHRERAELEKSKKEVQDKIAHRLSQLERRRAILAGLAELGEGIQKGQPPEEVPFERKRRILKQLLDCIWVDTVKKTIRLEGVLKSSYGAEATTFVFGSTRKSR